MIYDYSAKTIRGQEVSMKDYEGKAILIVNTASKCGLTSQLKELEEVYQEYKSKGLVVLGFPCGQFKQQEFLSNSEISEFCQINYGVSFTMFEKIDVNGENEHPIYTYLKSQQKGILGSKIKWNFTKFLIDQNGKVIKRYAPITKPSKIKKDLDKILK